MRTRNISFRIWLTPEEKDMAKRNATIAGYATVAAYLRSRIMEPSGRVNIIDAKELLSGETQVQYYRRRREEIQRERDKNK